jgi:regulator of protease activity HflC (stomatin/prohibitin superfamily)
MISEKSLSSSNGLSMLAVGLAVLAFSALGLIARAGGGVGLAGLTVLIAVTLFCFRGLFTIAPNEAVAVSQFGDYLGTVREGGLRWVAPWKSQAKVSLRTRTFETDHLKVNDHAGNPIEIAAIITWRVTDTARALFAVDDYIDYVPTQTEAALRALAARYPYEATEAETVSLRADQDAVAAALAAEIGVRMEEAGVEIAEARLSHLAYAPEIAAAMLQRQQADAVVAARGRIVEGAVGIAAAALEQLTHSGMPELDDARRVQIVGDLLLVLCSDRAVNPVMDLSGKRG